MNIFAVCPKCGYETEIKNLDGRYVICDDCKELYNISGSNGKVRGIELAQDRKRVVMEDLNKQIHKTICNFSIREVK